MHYKYWMFFSILLGGSISFSLQAEEIDKTRQSVFYEETASARNLENPEHTCQELNEENVCYVPEIGDDCPWNDEIFQTQIRNGCIAIVTIFIGIGALFSAAS